MDGDPVEDGLLGAGEDLGPVVLKEELGVVVDEGADLSEDGILLGGGEQTHSCRRQQEDRCLIQRCLLISQPSVSLWLMCFDDLLRKKVFEGKGR